MFFKYKIFTTFYDFYNKCFLHFYCFNITNKVKKGFGFLFLLYLVSFFVETSFCDYNVEYKENDQDIPVNQLSTHKKYTLSELNSHELPRSEEGERFTAQQKKLLICAPFLTLSVIALFFIMNTENNDLQKKVQYLEKKEALLTADLEKKSAIVPSELRKVEESISTEEWQRPKGWQFGFGF